MENSRFTVKFRVALAIIAILPALLAAAIVHFPWLLNYKENVATLSGQLNHEIIHGIINKVDGLLRNATSTQEAVRLILSDGTVNLENVKKREQFYLDLLHNQPNFTWISYGWPNGDFFGVQRINEESIELHHSKWDPQAETGHRRVDTYLVDKETGQLRDAGRSRTVERKFFSPERSWFRVAAESESGEAAWTRVYLFSTNHKPGISTAVPMKKEGALVGVVSIALELDQISFYLKSLKVGKSGSAFIFNGQGEVISTSDPSEPTYLVPEGQKPRLKLLEQMTSPLIQVASLALKANLIKPEEIKDFRQLFFADPASGDNYFVTLAPVSGFDWVVGTVIPEADFFAEINAKNRRMTVMIGGVLFLFALLVFLGAGAFIGKPLRRVIHQTERIGTFQLDKLSAVPSRIEEISQLSQSMEKMGTTLSSFKKYLPAELVRTLLAQGIPAELGGVRKEMSILLIQVTQFDRMSQTMKDALLPHYGDFLREISEQIVGQKGTIDKFFGDKVRAFWGAPLEDPEHGKNACRAALRCQTILETVRLRWEREKKPPFHSVIAINTGPVIVGNIGHEQKMDYTVIGDVVDLNNQVVWMAERFGAGILLVENTHNPIKEQLIVRTLCIIPAHGRERGLVLYELLGLSDEAPLGASFEWVTKFEQALALYEKRQWQEAEALFKVADTFRGGKGDAPSRLYAARCQHFIHHPPPEDWSPLNESWRDFFQTSAGGHLHQTLT